MAGNKLTVVISQAQGKHPVRSQVEGEIAAALLMEPDVNISLVPHLYDMAADHTGLMFLKSLKGPFVVLGWQYPRALRWTLDRQQIRGLEGFSELIEEVDEEEEEPAEEKATIEQVDVPQRRIYCIDLKVSTDPQDYLTEIRRIVEVENQQLVELDLGFPASNGTPSSNGSNGASTNGTNGSNGNALPNQLNQYILQPSSNGNNNGSEQPAIPDLNEIKASQPPVKRRWYPVIDYSRCTNCMECIDFCLFGVYGVDQLDSILVEEQDNCKKGCPACSRVCPENAIIFPGHKTPAIAGAEGEVAGLKIDLSKLFGGTDANDVDLAVRERDAELMADGRDGVGKSVGLSERHNESAVATENDDLDDLMDELDSLGI